MTKNKSVRSISIFVFVMLITFLFAPYISSHINPQKLNDEVTSAISSRYYANNVNVTIMLIYEYVYAYICVCRCSWSGWTDLISLYLMNVHRSVASPPTRWRRWHP